jgi:tripartite-type tricarboxylate transporter receptor subunit TctC
MKSTAAPTCVGPVIGSRYARLALAPALALVCGVVAVSGAAAQPYPTKAIKLLLPFGVGSPPDALGRLIGQCLSSRFNQGVAVENRPGAGSTIGTKAAASAAPDGYTLLQVNSAFAYAQELYPNAGYDPITSFTPVAALASWSLLLVVNAELPVRTVQELIDYAKAHPGKVSIGYTLGSPPQVLAEMFKKASGASFNTVSYRQRPQLDADLLGGRIHAFFGAGATLLALIEQNKLRALATTAPARDSALPQVPSIVEAGFPLLAYNPSDWIGIVAPAGTPSVVVNTLNVAIADCLKSPDVRANILRQGAEARVLSPAEFGAFIADEVRKWPPRVRETGLKAD